MWSSATILVRAGLAISNLHPDRDHFFEPGAGSHLGDRHYRLGADTATTGKWSRRRRTPGPLALAFVVRCDPHSADGFDGADQLVDVEGLVEHPKVGRSSVSGGGDDQDVH